MQILQKFSSLPLKILIILFCFSINTQACTLTYAREVLASDVKRQQNRWLSSPLHKALQQATGCNIVFKPFISSQQLRQAVMQHQLDFAYLKDFNFYLVQNADPNIKPIAVALSYRLPDKKLSAYYSSFILTLTSNENIHTLSDLKGKILGFASPESTSGYILPKMLLANHGIDHFKKIEFFNDNDDKLYQALLARKVDAIATWDGVIIRNKSSKTVRILKIISDIPNPAIVTTHPFSPQEFKNIQNAIVHIAYYNNPKLSVQGYVVPTPNMYSSIFKLFKQYEQISKNS